MDSPVTITLLISVGGMIITVFSVINTVNKGTAVTAQQTGMIIERITQMERKVDELKTEIRDTSVRLAGIENRLTKAELYLSNDNERLNNLEGRKK